MLLRSAFWLSLAFVVLAPRDADIGREIGAMTDSLRAQAVAAGQQMIVETLLPTRTPAAVIKPAAAIARLPSLDSPMQGASSQPAPIPRPRPAWMG
jgi:hypothetical protein